jgi:hypothetical protein
MKLCKKCNETKPLSKFGENKDSKDGFTHQCKSCKKMFDKAYYQRNKAKKDAQNNKWAEENRESSNKIKSRWKSNNKGAVNADYAKRRAAKKKATPMWYEKEAIKQFYINCPEGHHVDHIVPLQGVNVRGLHILANLQYLTAEENLRKSNKF